ncbi:MAG: MBL fold metallo-hydrolase [Thermoplasmatota archaeon]
MKLTVLGMHSGGIPSGSGYLVESGDAKLLLDCGNGVLGALEARTSHRALSAIALTHRHHDHVSDIYPIALSARYGKRKVPLLAPEGTRDWLAKHFALFSEHPDALLAALEVREMSDATVARVGQLRVTSYPAEHGVPALSFRIEGDGRVLAFTGDTRAAKGPLEAARGADLLLAEATFTGNGTEASRPHHMTAREAATLAREAGAKRLVLTHVLAHLGTDAHLVEARDAFAASSGDAKPSIAVEVARVGATYEV